ncbi:DUF4857 domain-containing protein [Desulfobotulus sp. H1]|uniref:DUF4857 domain-containing protein n=1 Tax=Desulfobotulus pelophilus TaxID=2823377 RepID=A0ABT3N8K4_9BACT|nr:DUF4857 domain-containing protein [Desulfobotulus pelophilus]MCW7753784.1 DUF4857 domain-containing protein [Desulfobotulus pelophilus]
MTVLSRYAAVVFAVLILSTFLPRFFWQAMEGQRNRVDMFYSPVNGEFLFQEQDRYGRVFYRTEHGQELDQKAFALLLPFRYARDLMRWGEMPGELHGVAIDADQLQRDVQQVRMRPTSMDGPEIPLYFVMEAASGFVDLEMPDEVMRISGSRAEFVRVPDNTIHEEKSLLFTESLAKAGFRFPAERAWANTSTRKPFDWGWFLLDAEGTLFHLMQVRGQARVRPVRKDFTPGVRYVQVEEHPGRHVFGLLVDREGRAYRMNFPDYDLRPLPMQDFNPSTMRLTWRRDPLVHQYTVEEKDALTMTITDHEDRVIRHMRMDLSPLRSGFARQSEAFFFPFRVFQSVPDSSYLTLRMVWNNDFLMARIMGVLVGLGFFVLWRWRQGIAWSNSPVDWLVIIACGFPGLMALIWAGSVPGQVKRPGRAV